LTQEEFYMSKKVYRPFWSYDVVKTEEWLSQMHAKGYALLRIHFAARLFYFEETVPAAVFYRISLEKKSNGTSSVYLENNVYTEVCSSPNYYVIRTQETHPEVSPSYNGFLSKNKKIKFVVGIILLCVVMLLGMNLFMFAMLASVFLFFGGGNIEFFSDLAHTPHTAIEVFNAVMTFVFPLLVLLTFTWLSYTYFKLRKTNRQLEKLCGDTLDLSFTLPRDTLISDAEMKKMSKNHKVIIKTKIGWIYSPDKIEIWLEKMESRGYHLVRMGKLGNSFYFISSEPRKMKFHVDYQNSTDPSYFNLNKESGWKLFFTSLSRTQSNNVWAKEYTEEPPMFYSDKESTLKHARRFALTYSLSFFPVCVLYIFITIMLFISNLHTSNIHSIIAICIIYSGVCIEFGSFAVRTILYYFRVKKSFAEK